VLEKAMLCTARHPAFNLASATLKDVGDIVITGRHLRNLTVQIGGELEGQRDAQTQAYFHQPLPRVRTTPSTPIPLACVSLDGGRMQTRCEGGPNGVQEPHWRETKNALFMRMTGVQFPEDPHPELPTCFQDPQYLKQLLGGIADAGDGGRGEEDAKSDLASWRPERLFRTCLSSLCGSDAFGRMMEAEADSRGFFHAAKAAFVGDGLPYNWTLQKRHFPHFIPILDFPHAIERIHHAAQAVCEKPEDAWRVYVRWANACWQGHVNEMLEEMREEQQRLGKAPEDAAEEDPRRVIAEALTYFQNNARRMDYPTYRRDGLPISSAYMESLVKEMNYRVKGTEKFWNDGSSGEAILQLRAASLGDDDRLRTHIRARPGNPFRPNVCSIPVTAG
jgi:hypothetical protein